jgi:SH3 domain protein
MNARFQTPRLAVALAVALLASSLEVPHPLSLVHAKATSQVTVTASVLNVRAGPGTHYAIITKVPRNTRLTVQKQQGSWLAVRLPNGLTGWVSNQYVQPVDIRRLHKQMPDIRQQAEQPLPPKSLPLPLLASTSEAVRAPSTRSFIPCLTAHRSRFLRNGGAGGSSKPVA